MSTNLAPIRSQADVAGEAGFADRVRSAMRTAFGGHTETLEVW